MHDHAVGIKAIARLALADIGSLIPVFAVGRGIEHKILRRGIVARAAVHQKPPIVKAQLRVADALFQRRPPGRAPGFASIAADGIGRMAFVQLIVDVYDQRAVRGKIHGTVHLFMGIKGQHAHFLKAAPAVRAAIQPVYMLGQAALVAVYAVVAKFQRIDHAAAAGAVKNAPLEGKLPGHGKAVAAVAADQPAWLHPWPPILAPAVVHGGEQHNCAVRRAGGLFTADGIQPIQKGIHREGQRAGIIPGLARVQGAAVFHPAKAVMAVVAHARAIGIKGQHAPRRVLHQRVPQVPAATFGNQIGKHQPVVGQGRGGDIIVCKAHKALRYV